MEEHGKGAGFTYREGLKAELLDEDKICIKCCEIDTPVFYSFEMFFTFTLKKNSHV